MYVYNEWLYDAYFMYRCYEWGLHADFKDTSSPEYVPLYANSFPSLTGKLSNWTIAKKQKEECLYGVHLWGKIFAL